MILVKFHCRGSIRKIWADRVWSRSPYFPLWLWVEQTPFREHSIYVHALNSWGDKNILLQRCTGNPTLTTKVPSKSLRNPWSFSTTLPSEHSLWSHQSSHAPPVHTTALAGRRDPYHARPLRKIIISSLLLQHTGECSARRRRIMRKRFLWLTDENNISLQERTLIQTEQN